MVTIRSSPGFVPTKTSNKSRNILTVQRDAMFSWNIRTASRRAKYIAGQRFAALGVSASSRDVVAVLGRLKATKSRGNLLLCCGRDIPVDRCHMKAGTSAVVYMTILTVRVVRSRWEHYTGNVT